MEEILSQNEIDALVAAAASKSRIEPEEPEQPVVAYDFRRPNKFSQEELRALHRIHESFARDFSGLMSARLRSRVDLSLNSLEQLTFGEFIRSLPNPSMLAVFDLAPLDGQFVVQLTSDIAFLLYDRLCGGPGRPLLASRELTDIELAVMRTQFLDLVMRSLHSAWQEAVDLSLSFREFESNPQFLQVMSERETVLLVSLTLSINDSEDMVNMCLSHSSLEPVLPQIVQSRIPGSEHNTDPAGLLALKRQVKGAVVPLEVELGTTTVTVADILELEAGDVIPLETKKDENLVVKVGTSPKFKASPGRMGRKLGVVIKEVCSEKDGENGQ